MAAPKPTKVLKVNQTLYRVRIRRAAKGVFVDEYFARKKDAERFCRDLEDRMQHGKPIASNVTTIVSFREGVKQYLSKPLLNRKGQSLKKSTVADRRQRITKLIDVFGDIRLKNLDTWEKCQTPLEEAGWSNPTQYRYETALSRFFAFAVKEGWMAFNPADGQERTDTTTSRKRTWKQSEWKKMLDAADARGDMLGMLLRLAWATGARRGELQKLRWVDVTPIKHDTLSASVWLRDTKTGGDRTVYIDKDLNRLLQAHEQQFRKPSSDLVFPPAHGDLWSIGKPFGEARAAAGLDKPDKRYGEVLNIHHVRHTWATRLGASGATLAQLMAAGGWSTPQIVMRYMKLQETQAAEAALLLIKR